MEVSSLKLAHAPYFLYKQIEECLDYVLEHYPNVADTWLNEPSRMNSGAVLYDKLSRRQWTCADLEREVENLSDNDILTRYNTCLDKYRDEGTQCTTTAVISLLEEVEELQFQLRMQEQQLDQQDQPRVSLVPFPSNSYGRRPPSPIHCISDDPDQVEFG